MHITMANNYLHIRGGSERVMFDEAAMLRQHTHAVSFFGQYRDGDPVPSDDALPRLVDLDTLSLRHKIAQAPRIIYNHDTYQRCRRFLSHTRPDVMHGHNIYGGLTTAVCDAALHQQIPMVLTLHDYKLICPSYLMLNHGQVCHACQQGHFHHCLRERCHKNSLISSIIYTVESYANRLRHKYDTIARFLCPSHFLYALMRDAGIPAHKLQYLPNAIDVTQYQPAFTPGAYIAYIGRLSHEKGLQTLFAALKDTTMPLRIIGDGPLRGELDAMVVASGMQDRVHFDGYQTRQELQRAYQDAACIVVPSECYENAPMTILEAYAYGKPVIGARIGGIPELITDGETGRLFDAGNSNQLAAYLQALWQAPNALRDMGKAARQLVCERFTLEHHVADLAQTYREICG